MRLLALLAPPLCVACGAPAGRQPLCPACRRALQRLPPAPVVLQGLEVWAPLAYEGPARALVRRLKFHGATALAGHMAAAIAANAPPGLLRGTLVAVPGRRRTQAHSELLAQALARRCELPLRAPLRRGDRTRQVGRARSDRLRSPPRFSSGAGSGEVVIVDDVVTTGATVAACARALRAAGWTCRAAVAYARTPVR